MNHLQIVNENSRWKLKPGNNPILVCKGQVFNLAEAGLLKKRNPSKKLLLCAGFCTKKEAVQPALIQDYSSASILETYEAEGRIDLIISMKKNQRVIVYYQGGNLIKECLWNGKKLQTFQYTAGEWELRRQRLPKIRKRN